jgi:hypothetical protein
MLGTALGYGAQKMTLRRLDGLRSQERGLLGAPQAPFAGRGGKELKASRVRAKLFRFARASGVAARKASRLPRAAESVFGARPLTRISNFWALAARCVIGKSWKSAEIV